jgi:hypothetical protein
MKELRGDVKRERRNLVGEMRADRSQFVGVFTTEFTEDAEKKSAAEVGD